MPTLEAVTEFWYDEKIRKIGDQFDASDEDARLLSGWNKARKITTPLKEGIRKGGINPPPKDFQRPDPPPPFKPGYKTSEVTAEGDDENESRRRKRKYLRLDMRAQE